MRSFSNRFSNPRDFVNDNWRLATGDGILCGMPWLVKEEPENYSFDQFAADGSTVWSGVKNPVAQRNLRAMKKGDHVFYYHTGKEKAVVGTAKVSAPAYPDPKDKS